MSGYWSSSHGLIFTIDFYFGLLKKRSNVSRNKFSMLYKTDMNICE